MKRSYLFILPFVFFAAQILTLQGATLEETFKKRINAEGKIQLILKNSNGNVTIESWDKNEVDIVAYKKVRSADYDKAEKLMAALEIDITERGDRIEVETIYPHHKKDSGFFSWLFSMGGYNCSVEYEIKVPQKFDLDIYSTNGSIFASACQGKIQLSTTNGKIEAESIKGALNIESTNGSIKATLDEADPKEDMDFKTTNGSIRLWLPEKICVDIEAHTTNGSIHCDLPMDKKHRSSRRSLDAVINDGGALIFLQTTNGSIHILEN